MRNRFVNELIESAELLCSEVEFTMMWTDPKANYCRLSEYIALCKKAVKAVKEGAKE